jgi:hypothetical protein
MGTAYSTGKTRVINLGGGNRPDYIMAALDEMSQSRDQEEERKRQAAQARVQGFYKRLPSDLTPDEMGTAMKGYGAADPEATAFLPRESAVPETPGSHFKRFIDQWHDKMMPAFVDALQKTPEKVDPQMFMTLYPYLSAGDKGMDPGIVTFLTDRYIAANEATLPPDFVKQYRMKAKIERTPEEIAKQGTEERGQDLTLEGKKYDANQQLVGTKYGVDAQRGKYEAEAGMQRERGRMYGSRADLNAEDLGPDMEMVNNHPAIQGAQAHIADLQKQRDQALIAAHSGKDAKAQAAARERADQLSTRIGQMQQNLTGMRTSMAKSMGVDLGDENDAADSGMAEEGEGERAAPQQPKINDMRGGNVPSRPGGKPQRPAAAPPPSAPTPSPAVGAPPAASAAPAQQGPDPQLLQQLRARKAAGQKVLKKSEFDQLRAAGIDTSGWQVVGQ